MQNEQGFNRDYEVEHCTLGLEFIMVRSDINCPIRSDSKQQLTFVLRPQKSVTEAIIILPKSFFILRKNTTSKKWSDERGCAADDVIGQGKGKEGRMGERKQDIRARAVEFFILFLSDLRFVPSFVWLFVAWMEEGGSALPCPM